MLVLKDSIKIKTPPKAIFEWLRHFAGNYKAWHPDHITSRWVKGSNFRKGSILYAEEYLGGRLEKLRFKSTNYVPNRLIEYKLLFPESIVCSGGSFSVEPYDGGSIFTATLSFRFGFLSGIFRSRIDAIRRHMKEEGKNLKMILEKGK